MFDGDLRIFDAVRNHLSVMILSYELIPLCAGGPSDFRR
jgi:hypothetical protein